MSAGPGTARDVAHAIENILRSPCIKEEWIHAVLDYVKAGHGPDGQRIARTVEMDQRMATLECEECREPTCPESCPVKAFRDLLKRGDCAAVMTD